MRILWYWPHPHRGESATAVHTSRAGDELTVLCLESFAGERLGPSGARYDVRRELPDVRRTASGPLAKAVDRLRVHVVRAWRRHRVVRAGAIDVVHVHMPAPLVDAVALPALRRHAPVVLHVHDVVPHRYRVLPQAERWLLRRTYRACDRLIVFHDVLADRLVDDFGVERARVQVVPLPIDAELRKAEHGNQGHLLFFGSFRRNKGLPELLSVVPELGPGIDVVIAGTGDADLESAVSEAAATEPHLRAEIGFATAERKAELYRWASAVVLPYHDAFASQSAVLFDAYVAGLPVVATDVGALGPTVRADGSGLVVPPGDRGALAHAIVELLGDHERWDAAAAAVLDAREAHRPQHVGPRYRSVYLEVLRERRGEAGPAGPEPVAIEHAARSIAVVIPVYDNAPGLRRAVDALDAQERPPDEVVIVDDGSADDTGAIADGLVAGRPGWSVLHTANGGPSAARNAGTRATTADAVAYLDANDTPAPGWLVALAELLSSGAGLVGCGVRWIGADREQLLGDERTIVGLPGSFAVHRTAFDAVDGYDDALRFGENTDLVERVQRWCRDNGAPVRATAERLLVVNDPSPTRRHDRIRLDMVEHVLERDRVRLTRDRARRAQLEGIGAVIAARLGQRATARRLALAATRSRPANLRNWARLVALVVPGGSARWQDDRP